MGKQRKSVSGQDYKRSKKKEKGKGWSTKKKSPILNQKCAKIKEQRIKETRCPKCTDKFNRPEDLTDHLLYGHEPEEKWASVEESPEVGPSKVRLSSEEQDETTSSELEVQEHDD